jgi:HD-GYP domain-containing protein (c-di-GMP phosphodiesterase class II)
LGAYQRISALIFEFMIDIKKEEINVGRLKLGMYVTELDRSWVGTPFMLQGFILDDQADIDKLQSLCKFVYIDRTKSIGNQFAATKTLNVAIKREGTVLRASDPSKNKVSITSKQNPVSGKTSFLDILRDLKNYQAPQNAERVSQDGTMYNVKHGANTAAEAAFPYTESSHQQKSITENIAEDVGGFFSGLFKKRNKLKTNVDKATENSKSASETDDSYRITIYEEEPPVEDEIALIYPVYEQSQIATRAIFDAIANEQNLDLTAVSEILDNMVESIGRSPDALLWLAKLKQTDDHAYNHALNVSITLMAFGNFLALSQKQIKEIGLAGLLQDVGKVKLSADVMLKEGKLTREEYDYAKKHVDESLKILESAPDIPMSVTTMVAQHHERIDGSGYPNQLRESLIGLTSQIAGLIDTYCAITSHKTYAKGVFHQEALDRIHQLSGKQFSNVLVDQLVQFMGMYPVSSLVALNTGEVGVVIQQNQVRRMLPRLMLLLGPDKVRYTSPIVLNLLNSPPTPTGEPYRITKSLAPDSYGLNPSDFFA